MWKKAFSGHSEVHFGATSNVLGTLFQRPTDFRAKKDGLDKKP